MPRSREEIRPGLARNILGVAVEAAVAAGAEVLRQYRDTPRRDVERKGTGDFVTRIDRAVERLLREQILAAFPGHGFVGEESGATRPDADFAWVVDPIDGTSNYAQGLPVFAVSVACLHHGAPVASALHCAPGGVTFRASRGRGAFCGRRRLRVPDVRLDDASVIGAQWFRGEFSPGFLGPLCRSGARIRTFGSTVTQICDVAAGRLHANVQLQGKLWDIAAVSLLAEEAGARFTDLAGRRILPFPDLDGDRHYPSITAPPSMHRALVRMLRPAPTAANDS
ncbi:MAG: inositol monophosphatase family protein [Planctomycetota bacterium]|nr:inositol monophosphatase family protein [Planctomycetota bacterium]